MTRLARIAIGTKIGRLTVIGVSSTERKGKSVVFYRLKCECGNYIRTTGSHLKRQVSCGCARGGATRAYKRDNAPYPWTDEQTQMIQQLWDEGNNQQSIRSALGVPYNALQKKVAEMGLARDEMPKPRAAMPEWVRYEDMPPEVLARERGGRVPKPPPQYSGMSSSAAWAV